MAIVPLDSPRAAAGFIVGIGMGDSIHTLNRILRRGDGIAIYQNADLGHPELGHPKIVSYGGSQALLEHTDEPPVTMPDIGDQINWRYQLVAHYRGEPMPLLETSRGR